MVFSSRSPSAYRIENEIINVEEAQKDCREISLWRPMWGRCRGEKSPESEGGIAIPRALSYRVKSWIGKRFVVM